MINFNIMKINKKCFFIDLYLTINLHKPMIISFMIHDYFSNIENYSYKPSEIVDFSLITDYIIDNTQQIQHFLQYFRGVEHIINLSYNHTFKFLYENC